jgi:hypothetical protein
VLKKTVYLLLKWYFSHESKLPSFARKIKKKNQCKQGDKKNPIKLSLYFLKSYVFKISSKN